MGRECLTGFGPTEGWLTSCRAQITVRVVISRWFSKFSLSQPKRKKKNPTSHVKSIMSGRWSPPAASRAQQDMAAYGGGVKPVAADVPFADPTIDTFGRVLRAAMEVSLRLPLSSRLAQPSEVPMRCVSADVQAHGALRGRQGAAQDVHHQSDHGGEGRRVSRRMAHRDEPSQRPRLRREIFGSVSGVPHADARAGTQTATLRKPTLPRSQS